MIFEKDPMRKVFMLEEGKIKKQETKKIGYEVVD